MIFLVFLDYSSQQPAAAAETTTAASLGLVGLSIHPALAKVHPWACV